MKPIDILKAMDGVRAEYVWDAQQALDAEEEKTGRRYARKLWRVALLAAIIAVLLAVTAYAAGLFSIWDRGFPVPAREARQETENEKTAAPMSLSLNGYKESPEYQASAEWVDFYWDYVRHNEISNDSPHLEGASEEYVNICYYYGCYDKTMADKLFEIAEKYGLYLVSDRLCPSSMEEFILAAGTEDFLIEGKSNGEGYVYEDGTFSLVGDIEVPGRDQWIDFSLIRTVAGTLPPMSLGLNDSFTEWEYTNAQGDTVLICLGQEEGRIVILYDEEGVFLTINVANGSDRSRDDAEQLAEAISFHEAAKIYNSDTKN